MKSVILEDPLLFFLHCILVRNIALFKEKAEDSEQEEFRRFLLSKKRVRDLQERTIESGLLHQHKGTGGNNYK